MGRRIGGNIGDVGGESITAATQTQVRAVVGLLRLLSLHSSFPFPALFIYFPLPHTSLYLIVSY
jgi:hypothetical protein